MRKLDMTLDEFSSEVAATLPKIFGDTAAVWSTREATMDEHGCYSVSASLEIDDCGKIDVFIRYFGEWYVRLDGSDGFQHSEELDEISSLSEAAALIHKHMDLRARELKAVARAWSAATEAFQPPGQGALPPRAVEALRYLDGDIDAFVEDLRAMLHRKEAERGYRGDWRDPSWSRKDMRAQMLAHADRDNPIYSAAYAVFLHAKMKRDAAASVSQTEGGVA